MTAFYAKNLVINWLSNLVTMQAQREAPPDMQCKDKFLVQSAIVTQELTPKDITGDMVTNRLSSF